MGAVFLPISRHVLAIHHSPQLADQRKILTRLRMDIKPIKTKADYRAVLKEIDTLMAA